MNTEKIAILVDSGTDVPKEYIQRYKMYVAPLKIIFSDQEYTDGVDVTPELLYERFETEIPKTSLPTGEDVAALFDQIQSDGYEKVLAIAISSGLSGTYNVIDLIGRQYAGLEVHAVDTRNISIGSGMIAIQAAEDIASGMSWEEVVRTTDQRVDNSKVFFCVKTLAKDHRRYAVALMHSAAAEEAEVLRQELLKRLPEPALFITGQISPTLVVHTGPGLIGIGVHVLD